MSTQTPSDAKTRLDSSNREIYPSAPLRFVALEIQYDLVPTLATETGRALVYEGLREDFPVADAASNFEVTVGPRATPSQKMISGLRMMNRERTQSITVFPSAVTIEASVFEDSQGFFSVVEQAVRGVASAHVATTTRIGLRYVDEIRVPRVTHANQWHDYIDEHLVAGIRFGETYTVKHATGILLLEIDEQHRVMMRFGPQDGFAVDPNGPLRLSPAPDGHFFLLDFDSFWLPAEAPQEFDVEKVMATAIRLDDPPHRLFESAITDRLRNEVLRRSDAGN